MKKYVLKPFSSSPTLIDYKKELNPQQYEVVTKAEGPCLVLAGAGSGKTRVLIYRLAYLIEKGINPKNIMLVTFTNKASREMINRAEVLLKRSLTRLWMGTFHHIGNIILRKEAKTLGFSSNFTIIDREDAKDLVQDCIEDLGFSKQAKLFPKKDVILNAYAASANSQKNIDTVINENFSYLEEYCLPIKRVIAKYIRKKKDANIMDFEDLLSFWLKVLEDKETREKYSGIFQYILVDEYQDTNRLQFEILKKISYVHKNILVVGDDAQSIYSFRAAEIKNILEFPDCFENTKIFKLETNYRSTPQILDLANSIINNNKNQFPKHLKAVKKDLGLPALVKTYDVYKQADFVAQKIMELHRQNMPLKEIAVLFRSRYLALELEVELMKRNIPYIIRGGLRFFEQAHIKDVFSYLKIVLNPQDELSYKRALCLHSGIGRTYAYRIWKGRVLERKNSQAVLKTLPKKAQEGYKEFLKILAELNKEPATEKALRIIIDNYQAYCYVSFDNSQDRLMDLEELAKMARNHTTIRSFLEDLSSYEEFKGETLLSPAEKEDSIVLSTIHQAKGLEWRVVFTIGLNEYDFPHPKALESQERLEEERRLFYVAVTRTKQELYLVYPESKYTYKNGLVISRPSMFVYEIPDSLYEEWDTVNSSDT
ncbi:MAG: ATP-dependent helicase [Candidatus Omnitrophica bacterium]|nr:ATP-dependent helicase [Candidatus Omnitrophota bacterium]